MQMTEMARAKRKEAQLARLGAKSSPDYPMLYAQQPIQLVRMAEQEAKRQQIQEAKAALEVLAMSEHVGAAEVFSGAMSTAKGGKK